MIKVLHVLPILGVGGASRLMSVIIPKLNANSDVKAELCVSKVLDDTFIPVFNAAGVNVHVLGTRHERSLNNILQLASLIKHNSYDIVHVHLFPSLYFVALANLVIHKPLVYTEHSTSNSRRGKKLLRWIEKLAYTRYVKIICVSKQVKINLQSWIMADDDDTRLEVIDNCIDLRKFAITQREKVYPHTLIMVSRFTPAKDHLTVIKSMTLLDDDIHLILVGDGETKSECEKLVESLNLGGRVHFVGVQSNIPSWIARADIGIQSSHWEGMSLSVVELMAGGLPVVASDTGGMRQVVEGAGILFPCGDYAKLAEVVKSLLTDKAYYDRIAQRCHLRSKKYDIDDMVQKYKTVYRNVSLCKN